jgi:group I intron endonuclease
LNQHRRGKSSSPIICNAIAKYGWDAFDKTVLEFCPVEELDEKEIYYIAELKPEYNLSKGGGGPKGCKPSPETIEILREAAKKQWANEEYLKLIRKPIICLDTGKIFDSVKSVAASVGVNPSAISAVLNGRVKTAGGYRWAYLNPEEDKVSEETSKKLSKATCGRKQSAEQIEKRVAHLRGKSNPNFNSYKPVVCVETNEIFDSVNSRKIRRSYAKFVVRCSAREKKDGGRLSLEIC